MPRLNLNISAEADAWLRSTAIRDEVAVADIVRRLVREARQREAFPAAAPPAPPRDEAEDLIDQYEREQAARGV